MKKVLVILILCLSALLCGCSKKSSTTIDIIKDKGYLTVGVKFDTKPFGYIENNEVKGLDIDIAKQIAKTILSDENKIRFVEVNPQNRISKLMGKEVDIVVATMTDTPQRRFIVDFSIPYYISGQTYMCRASKDNEGAFSSFLNNEIIVVRGTTAEKTLKQYNNKDIKVLILPTYNDAFNSLIKGKNSCIVADEAILLGFSSENKDFIVSGKKLTNESYAVAVRVEDKKLKEYVNHTINYLQKTGEIEKIIEKWIN